MNKKSAAALFILGPTAVGKSDLAVEVATRFSGEIIGADALQIYRGLDLLTAKPSAELLAKVPHHLIGEIPLDEECDAARFARMATSRIGEVQARGRLPIVVGGTGFYVRALTHELPDLPGADPALRRELERAPLPDLLVRLAALDPICMTRIDQSNPRRVVRALEVCLLTGRPFSSFRPDAANSRLASRGIILTCESAVLAARIDARTAAMWAAGVVDEVREVFASERRISRTARSAIGFRDIERHLAGELSASDCIAAIQLATRQYAKRQATWFRRDSEFVRIEGAGAIAEIESLLKNDG